MKVLDSYDRFSYGKPNSFGYCKYLIFTKGLVMVGKLILQRLSCVMLNRFTCQLAELTLAVNLPFSLFCYLISALFASVYNVSCVRLSISLSFYL